MRIGGGGGWTGAASCGGRNDEAKVGTRIKRRVVKKRSTKPAYHNADLVNFRIHRRDRITEI